MVFVAGFAVGFVIGWIVTLLTVRHFINKGELKWANSGSKQ